MVYHAVVVGIIQISVKGQVGSGLARAIAGVEPGIRQPVTIRIHCGGSVAGEGILLVGYTVVVGVVQ